MKLTIKIWSFNVHVLALPLTRREERHMRAALSFYIEDQTPDADPRAGIVRALEAYIDSTGAAAQDLLKQARTWSPRKTAAVLRQMQANEDPR